MLVIRICKICGKRFLSRTYRHIYCHRECFKAAYKKGLKSTDHPIFVCPNCGEKIKLDFHPRSSFIKWQKYKCPNCGYKPVAENR